MHSLELKLLIKLMRVEFTLSGLINSIHAWFHQATSHYLKQCQHPWQHMPALYHHWCNPIQIWPSCCFFVPRCARNEKAARGSDLNWTSTDADFSVWPQFYTSIKNWIKRAYKTYSACHSLSYDLQNIIFFLSQKCNRPVSQMRAPLTACRKLARIITHYQNCYVVFF